MRDTQFEPCRCYLAIQLIAEYYPMRYATISDTYIFFYDSVDDRKNKSNDWALLFVKGKS